MTRLHKQLDDKAKHALFKLKQINVYSIFEVALELFDSLVAPIVIYRSEMWGAFLFKSLPDNDFSSACGHFPHRMSARQISKIFVACEEAVL